MAEQRPEWHHATRVAALFLVGLDGAELESRRAFGVGGGEAGAREIFGAAADVFAKLLAQVALEAGAGEQCSEGASEDAHRHSPKLVRREGRRLSCGSQDGNGNSRGSRFAGRGQRRGFSSCGNSFSRCASLGRSLWATYGFEGLRATKFWCSPPAG
jgi:hypothetical protein